MELSMLVTFIPAYPTTHEILQCCKSLKHKYTMKHSEWGVQRLWFD